MPSGHIIQQSLLKKCDRHRSWISEHAHEIQYVSIPFGATRWYQDLSQAIIMGKLEANTTCPVLISMAK